MESDRQLARGKSARPVERILNAYASRLMFRRDSQMLRAVQCVEEQVDNIVNGLNHG